MDLVGAGGGGPVDRAVVLEVVVSAHSPRGIRRGQLVGDRRSQESGGTPELVVLHRNLPAHRAIDDALRTGVAADIPADRGGVRADGSWVWQIMARNRGVGEMGHRATLAAEIAAGGTDGAVRVDLGHDCDVPDHPAAVLEVDGVPDFGSVCQEVPRRAVRLEAPSSRVQPCDVDSQALPDPHHEIRAPVLVSRATRLEAHTPA